MQRQADYAEQVLRDAYLAMERGEQAAIERARDSELHAAAGLRNTENALNAANHAEHIANSEFQQRNADRAAYQQGIQQRDAEVNALRSELQAAANAAARSQREATASVDTTVAEVARMVK